MIRPLLINNCSFHIYNSMGFFKPLLFIHHVTIPISEKKIPLVMCLQRKACLLWFSHVIINHHNFQSRMGCPLQRYGHCIREHDD